MLETGFLVRPERLVAKAAAKPTVAAATTLGPLCPKCSQPGLVHEAGCLSCVHCGWSKCG
jgi:ribonucleoside-diphosphate reductase alpha chain